jgi:CheY-like chemotaxis protein
MLTFLIIDDDTDDVQLFCEAVYEINESYRCLTATNAEEGLQLLRDAIITPDFIFLDLNMPRMNGKQCLEQIKTNARYASTPVIIYTTSKLQKDIEEMSRSLAVYFLTKPTRFDDLKKAISKIVKKNFEGLNYFSGHISNSH